MNLSLLIPLLNEDESLQELYSWIISVMKSNNYSYEVIFIDDGSTDNSWSIIEELAAEESNVKGIRCMKNFGNERNIERAIDSNDLGAIKEPMTLGDGVCIPNNKKYAHRKNGCKCALCSSKYANFKDNF
jgi:glycosyltransferase involved in cell wall biosynthesis